MKKYSKGRKFKKFSVEQRREYHLKRANSLYDKYTDSHGNCNYDKCLQDSKLQFSNGFLQTLDRGRPGNFDEKSLSYKKGCLSAEKAKNKAFSIKF